MKAANINQNVPKSKITPKKDISGASEKKADKNTAKTIPAPEKISGERGKFTLPTENLDIVQKISEIEIPTTKSNPFEISIGIPVKGRKKIGNKIIAKNIDKKDTRSKIFDHMVFIILYIVANIQVKTKSRC
ncbi:hypothetical protein A3D42_03075 [Candidatus Nomurabacteria bacterium RIFCSPHIGHO2_02_FULL_41_18]|uniref:Uncharacterized protein n=1 Tax=Candidatus Nomurabacteria bacterium RIFCSPHIGHO2_02_FULL_41_18 TaxID=1801754 RepID=A0A1F6W5V9_9BACT|nr:MAG: hypothetical protein A2737_02125 [Candidatus Nomurabacteria bacterium RIFCSPHIGHO2_01_FULL_41_71]OGI77281.1 MAG: hypothetical protein A3D42_03075 [Candidatus Nomurabacteria bacterium RIFCSPHIGHO2_02_FULL_41_18]OGJ00261.1 MAG: hypothetical protein A3I90_02925 [Candidatus Nomurabacteria bacterium RIFCSPLOWO2_02_FULL_41_9]